MDFNLLKTELYNKSPDLFYIDSTHSVLESNYFIYYGLNFQHQFDDITHRFSCVLSGQYHIACHYYKQKKMTKGTFFLLHGYYDHSGLFKHLIKSLIHRGFNVVVYDLPGHGLSSGQIASIDHFFTYRMVLNDILKIFNHQAAKPWFALGQSTGAAILIDYLLRNPLYFFNDVVLLAPLIRPYNWVVNRLYFHMAKYFIKQLPRVFSNNSCDQDFLQFVRNDPLSPDVLPLKWINALNEWINKIERITDKSVISPLIVQGTNDKTVDANYNIQQLQKLFTTPKVLMLTGAKHHLPNELSKTRYQYMQWVFNQLQI